MLEVERLRRVDDARRQFESVEEGAGDAERPRQVARQPVADVAERRRVKVLARRRQTLGVLEARRRRRQIVDDVQIDGGEELVEEARHARVDVGRRVAVAVDVGGEAGEQVVDEAGARRLDLVRRLQRRLRGVSGDRDDVDELTCGTTSNTRGYFVRKFFPR